MNVTKTQGTSVIRIEVLVPIPVPVEQRARFEQSLARFLFGSDRVRPELRDALTAEGVDFNHLAALSQRPSLGVCPSPGAVEFVPTERLAEACKRHGIDLTSGGCVLVSYTYDAYEGTQPPSNSLEIRLKLPAGIDKDISDSSDLTQDVVTALFGDCRLPEQARAYLRTHGVDLEAIASRNAVALGGPDVPFTSRVSPEIHRFLNESGFNVDQYGKFDVREVAQTTTELPNGGAAWSKTTCC
ncbi:hypothetical protein ACFYXM_29260 [Streptomyces sp. NPDC002476]|uniref:hypothetical protein n=1 Tax=Streptomyces sp. NPDC002476 TaxID=3364648 RepID=UPI003674319C